jgi:hypothetical protein
MDNRLLPRFWGMDSKNQRSEILEETFGLKVNSFIVNEQVNVPW